MSDEAVAVRVHPSEIIIEEMSARGWTQDTLASRLVAAFPDRYADGVDDFGKPYTGLTIARLSVEMYLDVGPDEPGMRMGETSSEFDHVFGVGDGFFVRLEAAWLSGSPVSPKRTSAPEGKGDE